MLAAFEDYLARTITLIAAALDGAGSPTLPDGAEAPLQPGRAFDLDGLGAGGAPPGASPGRSPAGSTPCASRGRDGGWAGGRSSAPT